MTLVFVFSRASAFSVCTSSFVHARNFLGFAVLAFFAFFAIYVPHPSIFHVARLMLHPRVHAGLSQSFATHVSEEVLIAVPVDVAGADQRPELFRLQLLPCDLPLQLSDDLFHAARSPSSTCSMLLTNQGPSQNKTPDFASPTSPPPPGAAVKVKPLGAAQP
jgi:hypothetical protein